MVMYYSVLLLPVRDYYQNNFVFRVLRIIKRYYLVAASWR